MLENPPVSKILEKLGVPHTVFRHAGPLRSVEQAARERAQLPQQVVRSIVFHQGQGLYLMVLVAGPGQISWPALRRYLGTSRIRLARKDEVLAVTGYPIGAVAPFGLSQSVRLLVDRSVLAQAEISLGSGTRGVAIMMRRADLMDALGEVELVDILGV